MDPPAAARLQSTHGSPACGLSELSMSSKQCPGPCLISPPMSRFLEEHIQQHSANSCPGRQLLGPCMQCTMLMPQGAMHTCQI